MYAPTSFVGPDVTGPVPIHATFIKPDVISITFDQGLVPGVLSGLNWTARFENQIWNAYAAGATGPGVNMALHPGLPDLGPDVVHYSAAVPDVVSLATGIPAPAFTHFPLT